VQLKTLGINFQTNFRQYHNSVFLVKKDYSQDLLLREKI